MLQKKVFTNGETDMTFVAEKYQESFEEAVGSAQSLHFVDLGWNDAEAIQVAAALPYCNRLEQLALQNNNITAEGATVVVQAALKCTLQGLDLGGNPIDENTKPEMVRQWLAGGKVDHWLSLGSKEESSAEQIETLADLRSLNVSSQEE